ncbi:sugar-transfer associated ATP-grasp domain-containing protein [Halovenus marina]|uniref:sugar-transfer associated ATP-grasp domain-containing protein n=1 Tax=Halovenus marina TaxID=3396621 RepID=UPI003F579172
MNWDGVHAATKSAFLSLCHLRTQRIAPLRSQLSQFLLREVNSWSTWVGMEPGQRLRNYRNGFLSHSAALYDFESHDRDQFLTDFQREKTAYINDEQFVSVLANKVGFYAAMAPFESHRPETFGIIDEGLFHPIRNTQPVMTDGSARQSGHGSSSTTPPVVTALTESNADDPVRSLSGLTETTPAGAWVLDQIRSGQQLILKPVHAAGGTGVKHCSYRDGECRVNGERTSDAALREMVEDRDANVAMEFVEQAAYARDLYPASTNTVRVLTMWDSEREEAFCPVAVHRIGTDRSAPVDNFDRGGISSRVDLERGELGTGVQLAEDGVVKHHDTHPETGAQITGTQIPGWSTILDTVLEIAEAFSYVPYTGWDVVVTEPGEFVLLEANNCPGVKSLQAHGPLLTDRRTRAFYARHGVCSPA